MSPVHNGATISSMGRNYPRSKCVANKRGACSASSPNVVSFEFTRFPEDIQKKIKEQGIEGTYQRCTYCDTVWTSYYDSRWQIVRDQEIMTRDIAPGGGTIVFI